MGRGTEGTDPVAQQAQTSFRQVTRHKDFVRGRPCSPQGAAAPSLAPHMAQENWTWQCRTQMRVMEKLCRLIISTLHLSCSCVSVLQDF